MRPPRFLTIMAVAVALCLLQSAHTWPAVVAPPTDIAGNNEVRRIMET